MKWIVLLSLWFVFAACTPPDSENSEDITLLEQSSELMILSQTQADNIGLLLDSVKHQPLKNTIKLNGFIGIPPHGEALITSVVEAQVIKIKGRPFHMVSAGEILFELQGHSILDLQQKFLEQKSELKLIEKEFNRKKQLLEGGHIADIDFEIAERDYYQLLASLSGFESKLRMINIDPEKVEASKLLSTINIRSPFSGSVEEIYTRINEFVHPGDPLARIINLNEMHVELEVFEKDIPMIKLGQEIEFWLLDQSENHYTASIYEISKEVNSKRRTVTVHAHINRQESILKPGNFVEARLTINEERYSVLPDDAFVKDEGLTYIFKISEKLEDGYAFQKVAVVPGLSDGGYTAFELLDVADMKGLFAVKGVFYLMGQARILEGRAGGE